MIMIKLRHIKYIKKILIKQNTLTKHKNKKAL